MSFIGEFITGLILPTGHGFGPGKGEPGESEAQTDRRFGRWLLGLILGAVAYVVAGYLLKWAGW